MADIDRRCNAATGDRGLDSAPDRVENGFVGQIAGALDDAWNLMDGNAGTPRDQVARCHDAETSLT
jgi:hypothetical protein